LTLVGARRIIRRMGVLESVVAVVLLSVVVGVIVVLPIMALWRARLQTPPGRDPRFVQHSEHPMPDKSYHGQGRGGM
jgi:hypothetical protein